MRLLYTLLLYLITPLLLARLAWRGRRQPGYRQRWGQRLGFGLPKVPPGGLWLHAVSVGEVQTILPLLARLRERLPDCPILVTTTTPTGAEVLRRGAPKGVVHAWLPFDLPGAVARFLRRTRPACAVIVETELWPNTFAACARRQIPLLIVNARLSERSLRGYRRLRPLAATTLTCVTRLLARDASDADRFIALGTPPQRVSVGGNLKFDIAPPPDLAERRAALRRRLGHDRPIWIAASTHPGEEALALAAHAAIRRRLPGALLILAPRHPERCANVEGQIRASGMGVTTRSSGAQCSPVCEVFLLDTLGELGDFYAAADVAFVGGSLVATGGHNILEPALTGTAIVHGPHMFNFAAVRDAFRAAGATREVANDEALAATVSRLLGDRAEREALADAARQVLAANRGALDRVEAAIVHQLRLPPRP